MSISCIIVDDEPIARKGLQGYAGRIPFLEIKGLLPDAIAAMNVLVKEDIDLMILDINMPELSGLGLLRSLKQPPLSIIITAFPQHAVEGFELDVIDYIVKPVSFDRFLKAVNKAKDFLELKTKAPQESGYFFIKEGSNIEKINIHEILFIESLENYTAIYTKHKKHMALLSLKLLQENLPVASFVKVHRSFIVNIEAIERIESDEIIIRQHKIPVSRANRGTVVNNIIRPKLLKRKQQ